jgi:hypothetical protein
MKDNLILATVEEELAELLTIVREYLVLRLFIKSVMRCAVRFRRSLSSVIIICQLRVAVDKERRGWYSQRGATPPSSSSDNRVFTRELMY